MYLHIQQIRCTNTIYSSSPTLINFVNNTSVRYEFSPIKLRTEFTSIFVLLRFEMKWRDQTRCTLTAPHLISFTRNTKLSLIFVGTEHRCAAATHFFRGGKHRSWVITWRRFGRTYWFHLPTSQDKPTDCRETHVTTNLRCLTSQKSEGLNYRKTKA